MSQFERIAYVHSFLRECDSERKSIRGTAGGTGCE